MTGVEDRFIRWRQILEAARSTPSPHNVQPWRIKLLSPELAELYIDGTRTLPNEDHTGSFLLSAMGMFLEALDLLAAHHGLTLEAELANTADWFAERIADRSYTGLTLFATLRLLPQPPAPPIYPPEIFLRRQTSRVSLKPTPVPAPAVQVLSELAEAWGHRYTHLTDSTAIEQCLSHNIDAVFHDMNVAPYHDEITEWFRFTPQTAAAHKDGLDWRCMNVSRTEFWMSARLPRVMLMPGLRSFLKRRYRKQLGHVPAIGILSGDFFHVANAIHSGRFLFRFWLEVTRLGLYLHPYGNLVTNEHAAAWLLSLSKVPQAWLVFKLGYSEAPPRSLRRDLDDILIPTDISSDPKAA